MSRLDVRVSIYNGVRDNEGRVTLLSNFLFSRKYAEKILAIRSERNKERQQAMKVSLPLITVSGEFWPSRKRDHLIAHSGFFCVDIDGKDNPDVGVSAIRDFLLHRKEVIYASLSARGNGMFAIIPINVSLIDTEDSEVVEAYHSDIFHSLKREYYEKAGIVIDKCFDVTRLRAYSFDPDYYLNERAECYTPVYSVGDLTGSDRIDTGTLNMPVSKDSRDLWKVDRCVSYIRSRGIDITQDYNDWMQIGAALAHVPNGESYFHAVSRFYPHYNYEEAHRKFMTFSTLNDINLGAFFKICKDHGVRYFVSYN